MAPPVSNNWGFINNPKFDELVTKARQTFDPTERDAALAELHAASVDDAAFLYVAHDVAPRAMSPKVTGFVQPKSWFVDFSPISMTPVIGDLRFFHRHARACPGHPRLSCLSKDVDGRDKPGHDG